MSSRLIEQHEKIFAERLKQVRSEKGFSQKQLGEMISVIPQAISNFENGHNLPTFGVLVRLADALAVSIDWRAGRFLRRRPSLTFCR